MFVFVLAASIFSHTLSLYDRKGYSSCLDVEHFPSLNVMCMLSFFLLQPFVIGNNFTVLYGMLMLLFDLVLYLFLAWYIENVKPGDYGVPKPPCFFLKPNYW